MGQANIYLEQTPQGWLVRVSGNTDRFGFTRPVDKVYVTIDNGTAECAVEHENLGDGSGNATVSFYLHGELDTYFGWMTDWRELIAEARKEANP